MKLFNLRGFHFEWNRGLKHWGDDVEFVNHDTTVRYFRFYALFIFFGNPDYSPD